MTAETITLPREQVFEAAAWLFALKELFEEVEGTSPPALGEGWDWVAHTLVDALADNTLAGLDDDAFVRHPVLVELLAQAREHAAGMAMRAASPDDEHAYPLTEDGRPLTAKGLRMVADHFTLEAALTRSQGTISPKVPEHA